LEDADRGLERPLRVVKNSLYEEGRRAETG
jgi:hypothetical protein